MRFNSWPSPPVSTWLKFIVADTLATVSVGIPYDHSVDPTVKFPSIVKSPALYPRTGIRNIVEEQQISEPEHSAAHTEVQIEYGDYKSGKAVAFGWWVVDQASSGTVIYVLSS